MYRSDVSYVFSLEAAPDDTSRAALCYGPVVLAGELGTEGMQKPAPYSDSSKYNDYYTYNYHIPEGLPVNLVLEKSNWEIHLNGLEKV